MPPDLTFEGVSLIAESYEDLCRRLDRPENA
jgi:hypothetical protein